MKAPCLIVILSISCRASGDQPGLSILAGMSQAVPVESYALHPLGGPALRSMPEGTVPYAGEPVIPSLDVKQIYEAFCFVCHGSKGQGDGPIIGRFPNPPSFLSEKSKAMSDADIEVVIVKGRGIMSSYAAQVPPSYRGALVQYVRELQRGLP